MNLRQLPALNALRTFEAAARHESFSRAADELFVTHGAVSHQIRALEDALGTPLFLREGKRVRLTDVGCRYAKDVRAALMALADATREVREGQRARRLVVSSSSSFSARWITPRIGGFIERHPEIDLELLSTNTLTDFTREDVDVAIRFGAGPYPELHAEPLLDEVAFPVCAPTFNGGALPTTPAELAASSRLLRSDDQMWRVWFEAAGVGNVPEPRRGVLYQDSSNLLQAAVDGQGIALVRLFEIDARSASSHWFVCPQPLLASARVQAFRIWLMEEVERFRAQFTVRP
ncbi:transcriptional regulator GcvA [Trinickia dinghuensis]|uniref:Transcriptional regulator GcvA n=1 Tax=Trinickia dinghuensis TaxID=2291023 RepID=A0A3D8K3B6_9BURK|nr:transcriptional regulator GcvA [Trinickia dinghuensis]RDU99957.1 transcriptional regulator GcvA [Trinickia dinghuensis]